MAVGVGDEQDVGRLVGEFDDMADEALWGEDGGVEGNALIATLAEAQATRPSVTAAAGDHLGGDEGGVALDEGEVEAERGIFLL